MSNMSTPLTAPTLPASATDAAREKFRQDVIAGTDAILRDFYMRLKQPDASIGDLHKAVELGYKVHGLNNENRPESLVQVSWVVSNGSVSVNVTQPPPALEIVQDVTDVQPVTEAQVTPESALIAAVEQERRVQKTFDITDNLLDSL